MIPGMAQKVAPLRQPKYSIYGPKEARQFIGNRAHLPYINQSLIKGSFPPS